MVQAMMFDLSLLCLNLCNAGAVNAADIVRIMGPLMMDPVAAVFNTPLGKRPRLDRPKGVMDEFEFALEYQ